MASAPLITQIVSIIISPILSRLYSPVEYGIFSLFGSLSSPFLSFTTLGYSLSLLIADDDLIPSILIINILITILVTCLSASIILLFGHSIIMAFNLVSISSYLWVIPLSLFFYGLNIMLKFWNMRYKHFHLITAGELVRNFGNYLVIIPLGFSGYAKAATLILGSLFSVVLVPIILAGKMKNTITDIIYHVSIQQIKQAIVKYKKFPLYNTWIDTISRLTVEVPIYLLAIYFSQSVVGLYSFSLRLLRIPITYMSNSIGEVYFQRGSAEGSGNITLLEKILINVFQLSAPCMFMLCFIGEDIFSVLFGEEWKDAGLYTQILSIHIMIKLITNQATYLANIFQEQEYILIFNILDTIVIAISIILGGLLHNIFVSLLLITILSGITNILYGFRFYIKYGINIKLFLVHIMHSTVLILPSLIIIGTLKYIFILPILFILIASFVCIVLTYIVIVMKNAEIKMIISNAFRKIILNCIPAKVK